MKPDFKKEDRGSVPDLREALEAIRAHRDAEAGQAPGEEIQRLQVLADDLYRSVIGYRMLLAAEAGKSSH
ncbi:MAG: hypothetical protein P0Y58_12345 [Candidatus Pseudomonas phytovorans]|uniref:Uncharacterized protein n=1 Tax=Candidatus Pseudomonas phytovorans TaxID=3121377 RepID=A0AAJ5WN56_9PSED|nr:hypothetical protein [Pseudomonas sp.]WEK32939.1 MAG: hypothetical protein P0Y58_12345 [Pseudomonas sp.]